MNQQLGRDARLKHWPIRIAILADAEVISQIIVSALRQSNARDYPAEVIERVAANFEVAAVRVLLTRRKVFVALREGWPVATASLDGKVIRTLFVAPDMQRKGLGRALIRYIEQIAGVAGIRRLSVPASLTAQGFYAELGYELVREVVADGERTLVMARNL